MTTPADAQALRSRVLLLPVDVCHLVYLAGTLVLVLTHLDSVPRAGMWTAVSVVLLAVAALVPLVARRMSERGGSMLRLVQTVATIPLVFTELGSLVPYVRLRRFEKELFEFDCRLFGGSEPLAMLGRLENPWLTEALQWVYNYYFFIPVILGVAVVRRDRPRDLLRMLFVCSLCIYLSYLGYYAVPASGPNIDRLGLYAFSDELRGVFMTREFRSAIAAVEQIKQDCFPSGHTAVSIVALLLAYRFARRTVPVLWPLVVALVFSTMYLRYHYVADVLAGVALAFVADRAGTALHLHWERRRGWGNIDEIAS